MSECEYQHEECSREAKVLLEYVIQGRNQDTSLCLDHLPEVYARMEDRHPDGTYVTDLHLLKEGRIWKDGYKPQTAYNSLNSGGNSEQM